MNACFSALRFPTTLGSPRRRTVVLMLALAVGWMCYDGPAALGQEATCAVPLYEFGAYETLSDADVEHVRLELALDPSRPPATGRAIVTLRTTAAAADSVRLLAPGLVVNEVISTDLGEALPFRFLGRDTLLVDLRTVRDSFLVARESITLDVGFDAVHGVQYGNGFVWTIDPAYLGGAWFPWSGDSADRFTSELHVTLPAENVVAAAGSALARRQTEDGRMTYLFASVEPHRADDLLFAAGPFVSVRSGFRIETLQAGPARSNPGGIARRALEYFESQLESAYPYGVLTLAVVPAAEAPISGGGIILVPDRLTGMPRNHLPRYTQLELVEAVARQWFGSVVSVESHDDRWLETGLTAYLAAVYAESEISREAFEVTMRRLAQTYFDVDASYFQASAATGPLRPRIPQAARVGAKGAWTAHGLRRRVGDDGFWEALAKVVSENRFASLTTDDLARAVEADAEERHVEFLDDWVHAPGHPELAASYSTERDTLFVTIEQRQLGDGIPEVYELTLVLEIGELSGSRPIEVHLDELRETFAIDRSADPRFVVIDSDMGYLAQADMEQSLAAWIAQLRAASTSTGRLAATKAIAQRRGHPDVLIGLRSAFGQESNPYVRAAILDVIRQLSATEAAERVLLSAYEDTSAVVRAAALHALSDYPKTPSIEDLALRAANEDPVEAVQAAAVETLGRIESNRALDVARAALITPSHEDVIRRAGLRVMGILGVASAIALDAASTYSGADQPAAVRLEAIQLLEKLARNGRRAENVLLGLLGSGDHRIRQAAAESLLRLGNDEAVRSFTDAERIPWTRRQVTALLQCR